MHGTWYALGESSINWARALVHSYAQCDNPGIQNNVSTGAQLCTVWQSCDPKSWVCFIELPVYLSLKLFTDNLIHRALLSPECVHGTWYALGESSNNWARWLLQFRCFELWIYIEQAFLFDLYHALWFEINCTLCYFNRNVRFFLN